jgi:BirA family biotin operon repressor/biotin-[acetyl-CoA-carboxylase] ligase
MLNPDNLTALLQATKRLGKSVLCYDEVGSTNTLAHRLAKEGAPEGLLITAEHQTNGKGRGGKAWQSSKGDNLMFSLILRPKIEVQRALLLPLLAADAVAQTATELLSKINGLRAMIKYPNDIMVDEKKISGVLLESRVGESVEFVVLGIGLNVNQTEFNAGVQETATSLRQLTARTFDRAAVLEKMIKMIDEKYDAFLRDDNDKQLIEHWKEKCTTLGREICFEWNGQAMEGKAVDIDRFGRLEIETVDERIVAAPSEILYIRPKHI